MLKLQYFVASSGRRISSPTFHIVELMGYETTCKTMLELNRGHQQVVGNVIEKVCRYCMGDGSVESIHKMASMVPRRHGRRQLFMVGGGGNVGARMRAWGQSRNFFKPAALEKTLLHIYSRPFPQDKYAKEANTVIY